MLGDEIDLGRGQPRAPMPGCTCWRVPSIDQQVLNHLDDLVAYGFDQPDASRMLWVLSRRGTTTHLRALGFHVWHTNLNSRLAAQRKEP